MSRPIDYYIAIPYSHPNPFIKANRYELATYALSKLTERGLVAFSPITHSHKVAVDYGVRGDWSFWEKIDYRFLDASRNLVVIKAPLWDSSRGVLAEIEYAKKTGIEVFEVTDLENIRIDKWNEEN